MEKFKKGVYRHFKGNYYRAFFQAQHSETNEWLVVYQRLYGDFGYSVRPVNMFLEDVLVEGKLVPRFSFIKEDI